MRTKVKKAGLLFMISVLAFSICGCGKTEEKKETVTFKDSNMIYKTDFKTPDFGCDYMSGAAVKGDNLVLFGITVEAETENKKAELIQYNIKTGEQKKTDVGIVLKENDYIQQMIINSKGNLLVIMSDKGITKLMEITLPDGTLTETTDITEIVKKGDGNVRNIAIDKSDNLAVSDGSSYIWLLDNAGKLTGQIPIKGNTPVFTSGEGEFFAAVWEEEGFYIKPINYQGKMFEKAVFGPVNQVDAEQNIRFTTDIKGRFLFADSNGMYFFDSLSGEAGMLINWEKEGISDAVYFYGQSEDGTYYVLSEISDKSSTGIQLEIAFLQETGITRPESAVPDKTEIVYGGFYSIYNSTKDIKMKIKEFNKNSGEYNIVFKNYFDESNDRKAAEERFNLDIISGNAPDIVELTTINYEAYVRKGLFEDLYPYMERDGIHTEDYLENILKVYEEEGKLYGILPRFFIRTAVGRMSDWGEKTGITVADIINKLEDKNNTKKIGYSMDRDTLFNFLFYTNMEDFINWETGECFFDSAEFIKILEIVAAAENPDNKAVSNQNPGSDSEMNRIMEENMEYMKQLNNKEILLDISVIRSVEDYQWYRKVLGEDLNYIGYPNKEGAGNLITGALPSLGINADSKCKDGAWEFVKKQIEDEEQFKNLKMESDKEDVTIFWEGFPIKKEAFDKMLDESMQPFYGYDENGNKIEKQKQYGKRSVIEIYPATLEETEDVRKIVASAKRLAGRGKSNEMYVIIGEEAAACFEGQKPAKDVAQIIQSRMQIYVNENR